MTFQTQGLPDIAIIIPVFNVGNYLAETITSILEQNYSNWELWLINDGSTDNTEEIIKSFQEKDSRIHYHKTSHIGVPGALRNIGASLSKAPLLFFFDADDILNVDALAQLSQALKNNPSAKMAYGFYTVINDQGLEQPFAGFKLVPGNTANQEWALPATYSHEWKKIALAKLCTSTVFLIQRSLFETLSGFDERFANSEDLHFFYKAFLANRDAIVALPFYLFQYRKSENSITRSKKNLHSLLKNQLSITKLFFEHPDCPQEAKLYKHEAFMRRYSYVAGLCLEQGDRFMALDFALKAIASSNFAVHAWVNHCSTLIPRVLLPTTWDRYLKAFAVQAREYLSNWSYARFKTSHP